MRLNVISMICLGFLLAACSSNEPEMTVEGVEPVALWNKKAEGTAWTRAAIAALDTHGNALVRMVPGDIETYCPAYKGADPTIRKRFWVTFLSALAKHESTWRADASGGGGQWHGLLQISPATARGYGCRAQTPGELKEGGKNLSCAVRIMSVTVPRDGVISAGMRGVAADWGPFHQAAKRADIQAATRSYPGCRA